MPAFVSLVQRAATFFQAVIDNNLSLRTVIRFVECPNSRYRCFGDSNGGCSDDDNCTAVE